MVDSRKYISRNLRDSKECWPISAAAPMDLHMTPALQQLKIHLTTTPQATQQPSWGRPHTGRTGSYCSHHMSPHMAFMGPSCPVVSVCLPHYLMWAGAARDSGQCTRAPPADHNGADNHLISRPRRYPRDRPSAQKPSYPQMRLQEMNHGDDHDSA